MSYSQYKMETVSNIGMYWTPKIKEKLKIQFGRKNAIKNQKNLTN